MREYKFLIAAVLIGTATLAADAARAADVDQNAQPATRPCNTTARNTQHRQPPVTTVIIRGTATETNTYTLPSDAANSGQDCGR